MRSSCRLGDRRTNRPRAARVTHFLTTRPLWPSLPLSSQVLNSFKTTDLSFAERKSALERIIDLQNRSETLGIGIRDRFGASEAYGNVVVEALACGVPVIAYDRGGPGEIIQNGETGWLVPPDDRDALAEATLRVSSIDRHACRHWVERCASQEGLAARVEAWIRKGLKPADGTIS